MDLDAYKGNYVMHCPTEASAWLFCGFLNENGRFCHDNTSYSVKSSWAILKENTVYFFNEGRIGTLATAEMSGYTIVSRCFSAITGKKLAEIEVQKIFDGMGQLVNENMYS